MAGHIKTYENSTPPYPVIPLAEGRDFPSRDDYRSLFTAIKSELEARSLLSPNLVFAGYDAAQDGEEAPTPRTKTFAMPLWEFEEEIDGVGSHPFMHASVKKGRSQEPTIGVYDSSTLHLVDGMSEYECAPGQVLDDAKVAEFQIVLAAPTQ
jgi:hypothetical protein